MANDDTVLITGGSGFLGSALVRTFREAGYSVRCLVRPSSPRTNLDVPGIELVEGDLMDPDAVRPAMKGMGVVVHAAADYRLWAPDPSVIVRTNIETTRQVMEEALRAGVGRVVYTSSVATIAPGSAAAPSDETVGPPAKAGAYKLSKTKAEQLVLGMVRERGLPAVIVNPSTPIGPRDIKPTPTGRIIVETARGRMPGFVNTGLNLAHVDDVAAGHLLALQKGGVGERYILGGENVTLAEMLGDIAGMVGRRKPTLRLPLPLVYPLAMAAETLARVTGRTPFINREGLRLAAQPMFYDDARARRELGYTSRPYREGLADAIGWFRQAGYLG